MRAPALPALLMALTMLAAAGGAAARTPFEARCEARQFGSASARLNTGVTVESHDNGYRVDNSLSWRSLTRIKRSAVGGAGAGEAVLGLTHAESRVAISLEGAIAGDPVSGEECLLPQIHVSLSYLPIVIHIGREFTPGSCAYREILAHEMRHLKSYVEYLPKVEKEVREALDRRYGASAVYAPQGRALAHVHDELDRRWMPFVKARLAKVKALQAGIDSASEYARLSKVCQGDVQSLIGSTRRSGSTPG